MSSLVCGSQLALGFVRHCSCYYLEGWCLVHSKGFFVCLMSGLSSAELFDCVENCLSPLIVQFTCSYITGVRGDSLCPATSAGPFVRLCVHLLLTFEGWWNSLKQIFAFHSVGNVARKRLASREVSRDFKTPLTQATTSLLLLAGKGHFNGGRRASSRISQVLGDQFRQAGLLGGRPFLQSKCLACGNPGSTQHHTLCDADSKKALGLVSKNCSWFQRHQLPSISITRPILSSFILRVEPVSCCD